MRKIESQKVRINMNGEQRVVNSDLDVGSLLTSHVNMIVESS